MKAIVLLSLLVVISFQFNNSTNATGFSPKYLFSISASTYGNKLFSPTDRIENIESSLASNMYSTSVVANRYSRNSYGNNSQVTIDIFPPDYSVLTTFKKNLSCIVMHYPYSNNSFHHYFLSANHSGIY